MKEHHDCGCGHHHTHEHHHEHGAECGCGCGHTHHHTGHEGKLTPAMEDFLHHLGHHHYLPVARFLVESSKETDFSTVALAPVYLRSADEDMTGVKETASMLLELERMGRITLDYGYALSGYSYEEYQNSTLFAYFSKTVEEAKGKSGFLGDTPVLEFGSIAPVEAEA